MMAAVKPRLLLVPSFTELEWGIRPKLEQWADVASFDAAGVGGSASPFEAGLDRSPSAELLDRWRQVSAGQGLAEVDRRGWERFVVVTDSYGSATAVRIAKARPQAVSGLAIGHAALSHSSEGERAPERAAIWEAFIQLARQGSDAFVRHGIAQMTRGGIDEQTAEQVVARFPDGEQVTAMVEAIGQEPEPIGDDLAELGLPLLLAKHDGCLASTDEGFADIVAAFPDAETVICPEMCASSPTFAVAIRAFAEGIESDSKIARRHA